MQEGMHSMRILTSRPAESQTPTKKNVTGDGWSSSALGSGPSCLTVSLPLQASVCHPAESQSQYLRQLVRIGGPQVLTQANLGTPYDNIATHRAN
jgi:hypothetical protein